MEIDPRTNSVGFEKHGSTPSAAISGLLFRPEPTFVKAPNPLRPPWMHFDQLWALSLRVHTGLICGDYFATSLRSGCYSIFQWVVSRWHTFLPSGQNGYNRRDVRECVHRPHRWCNVCRHLAFSAVKLNSNTIIVCMASLCFKRERFFHETRPVAHITS